MKIAIFTNILNPYRISFFDKCFQSASEQGHSFRVYAMTGEKSDRPWKYKDFQREYTFLLKGKTIYVKGITYFHFNTGLKKTIQEYAPDIVVMAGAYLQPTVVWLTKHQKKYGYKTFFWSESHFVGAKKYGTIASVIREKIRKDIMVDMYGFWYPGNKAKEFILKYASEHARLIQVPNTIDNDFFAQKNNTSLHIREKYHLKNTRKIIFTPSRLSPEKGLLDFCQILACLDRSSYCWLIAGDGDQKTELAELIREKDLNVVLLGLKNQSEIREIYYESDLFLLPSRNDPNPLSCVEAIWCGLPLFISEAVGNIDEVLREGENGYSFSYSDNEEAAKKLQTLLSLPDEWYKTAGELSKEIAWKAFDQKSVAIRTIKAITE